jgi:TPR repeat protein
MQHSTCLLMKTLRLILLGAVLAEIAFLSSAQAQIYSPRRLMRRIAPQVQRGPATAQPAPAPAPAAPAAPPPAARAQIVVRPAIDPGVAKAAREEADRKAIAFEKKRADEGSESAQYALGMRYLKGDGVEKDEVTARKWLTLSSKNGYIAATRRLEELNKTSASAAPKPAKEESKPAAESK